MTWGIKKRGDYVVASLNVFLRNYFRSLFCLGIYFLASSLSFAWDSPLGMPGCYQEGASYYVSLDGTLSTPDHAPEPGYYSNLDSAYSAVYASMGSSPTEYAYSSYPGFPQYCGKIYLNSQESGCLLCKVNNSSETLNMSEKLGVCPSYYSDTIPNKDTHYCYGIYGRFDRNMYTAADHLNWRGQDTFMVFDCGAHVNFIRTCIKDCRPFYQTDGVTFKDVYDIKKQELLLTTFFDRLRDIFMIDPNFYQQCPVFCIGPGCSGGGPAPSGSLFSFSLQDVPSIFTFAFYIDIQCSYGFSKAFDYAGYLIVLITVYYSLRIMFMLDEGQIV